MPIHRSTRPKADAAPRGAGAARRAAAARSAQAAAEAIAARAVSGRDRARRDRLRLLAAQERDQSAAADAQARRGRRAARAAGGGGARQAADHARLEVRRAARPPACGASASRRRTRPRSIPTSCWCRSRPSTARGHRIGYGAGYYDMTHHARCARMKPVVAIGIAFAAQEIAGVPTTPRDARLDLVLTEREVIDCREELNACAFCSSATWSGAAGAPSCSSGCRGLIARLEARSRRASTARTPPAASASPRRSTTNSSTPAPTRSRSAIMPGTSARRWCSSSARRG